jgi:hypothetical protein
MAKGIIYIMSTAVEGLIKIGITDNFERRMAQLEGNGYRNVAGLKRQFAIEVEDYDLKEMVLDEVFANSRVGNTELFSLDLNRTIQLLSSFEGRIIYPTEEKKAEVFKNATEAVQSSGLPNKTYTYSFKSQTDGQKYYGTLVVTDGKLILKAGAYLAPLTAEGTNSWITTRKSLGPGAVELKEDIVCTSVSIAANYIAGRERNGWKAWKDEDGNFIDIYRKKAIEDKED